MLSVFVFHGYDFLLYSEGLLGLDLKLHVGIIKILIFAVVADLFPLVLLAAALTEMVQAGNLLAKAATLQRLVPIFLLGRGVRHFIAAYVT